MLDENDKLYVMAARARGISGMSLLWRYPAKHSLGPVINSIGFDLNRIFSALPIVALILILTEYLNMENGGEEMNNAPPGTAEAWGDNGPHNGEGTGARNDTGPHN